MPYSPVCWGFEVERTGLIRDEQKGPRTSSEPFLMVGRRLPKKRPGSKPGGASSESLQELLTLFSLKF